MNFDKLTLFFDKVKNIGWLQRIFKWGPIRALSFEAYEEFGRLKNELEQTRQAAGESGSSKRILENEIQPLRTDKKLLEERVAVLGGEIARRDEELSALRQRVAAMEQSVPEATRRLEERAGSLTATERRILDQNRADEERRHQEELDQLQAQKETWSRHQEMVRNKLKLICEKLTIEYVDKVPFKGIPDNAIKICGEFLVLDAKCPKDDDLDNFPAYVRTQAEAAKKYAKEEGVRNDIYFVVPANAVDVLPQLNYPMGDYNVYIVTEHVLEPLLMAQKKLEEYEFVEQLTPEDRASICRIVAKFLHATKRRVIIDQYFAHEILGMVKKAEADLPEDIALSVAEFERAEALNPPQEKRGKTILTKDIEKDVEATDQKIKRVLGLGKPKRINISIEDEPNVLPTPLIEPPENRG